MRKQRILSVCSLVTACLILVCSMIPVCAEEDTARQLADACFQAIRDGKKQAEAIIRTNDAQAILDEMMEYEPVLCHYYDGATWTQYAGKIELVVKLKNLKDAPESIPVVTDQQELLAVVGLGMLELREKIQFVAADGFDVDSNHISDAFEALREQYYLVYMGYNGFSSQSISYGSEIKVYEVTVNFFDSVSVSTLAQWRRETEKKLVELSNSLFAADMPDVEAVLRIHDWIVNNARYNSGNMEDPGNYMAYGCLVRGSCVCQGYAETFRILCKAAGIDACYVTGTGVTLEGEESHGWNAVLLDGEWYMVDTTWDDPTSFDGVDILRYDYFLVTGDQLAADHNWDVHAFPICSSAAWSAENVLAQYGQSTTQYQQYGINHIVTMEQAGAEFTEILSGGKKQPEAESTVPVVAPTVPVQQPVPPEQKTEDGRNPILWVLLVLILLAAILIAVLLWSRQNRGYSRRPAMDPPTWSSARPNVKNNGKSGSSRDLPGSKW